MSEIEIKTKYKLKKSFWSNLYLGFLRMVNILLTFLSLRDTEQFWGIVYDSVTKQPLDPVIVKLLYADGREVETCVTDMAGRYGFLAQPGKFKIFARKTNYVFPSTKVSGSADGNYKNLYHGEFFELYGNAEVVAPNIPMDCEKNDWNQEEKKKIIKTHPKLTSIGLKVVAIIFWLGFAWTSVGIWQNYSKPQNYLYIAIFVYLFIFSLLSLVPEMRLWGKIIIKDNTLSQKNLYLELHNQKFLQVSFGKAHVAEDDKFLLRASKGDYLLTLNQISSDGEKTCLAELNIKVGSSGVFNNTIVLKQAN